MFTLSKKAGNDFLQEEQVKGEDTLEDGTITFTKGVIADTEYVVKATVVNYVGQNDGVELTITTPEEDGKRNFNISLLRTESNITKENTKNNLLCA